MGKLNLLLASLCFTIWIFVHGVSWYFPLPIWINSWLDDLLIVPFVLALSAWVQSEFILRKSFFHPYSSIFRTALFFGVAFEFLIPKFQPAFTADYIDVLVYFVGALFFGIIQELAKKRME